MQKETLEETIQFFIASILPEIIREEEIPKLYFSFSEKAIQYFHYLKDHPVKNDQYLRPFITEESLMCLKKENDNQTPRIYVKNALLFFSSLLKLSEKLQEYHKRYHEDYSLRHLQYLLFQRIFLRMTPKDFHDVEYFLKKQIAFLEDETFEKYQEEAIIGTFGPYEISVQNLMGMTYDENHKALQIRLWKGDEYHTLPLVRYDIYQTGKQKKCEIGAIQKKEGSCSLKEVERFLYKLNKNVWKEESQEYQKYKEGKSTDYVENISDVYPGSLFSLLVFLSLLKDEKIYQIEVPVYHVLAYDYHKQLASKAKIQYEEQKEIYERDPINRSKNDFLYAKDWYERIFEKEDFISKATTENFLRIFRRACYHYPSLEILNEPFLEGDILKIQIQEKKSDEIRPDILKEFWEKGKIFKYKR